jgi:TPR repeat protein
MTTLVFLAVAAALTMGAHNNPPDTAPRASANVTTAGVAALGSARAAEAQGRLPDAIRGYREAAAGGSGEAAKRLGDIYWHGAPGVERDLAESMRWYREAQAKGETVAQAVRLR